MWLRQVWQTTFFFFFSIFVNGVADPGYPFSIFPFFWQVVLYIHVSMFVPALPLFPIFSGFSGQVPGMWFRGRCGRPLFSPTFVHGVADPGGRLHNSLHGSGSTILTPGFDCDSCGAGVADHLRGADADASAGRRHRARHALVAASAAHHPGAAPGAQTGADGVLFFCICILLLFGRLSCWFPFCFPTHTHTHTRTHTHTPGCFFFYVLK